MIIYFYLLIPLLFLSIESSSIRGRNHKNDLVPFSNSRLDTMKKDPNSLKIVSKDPFIIQLQMPNSKEMEARAVKEKDTKRKRPVKKRVSKIKPLRKKHRKRRDLLTTKTKPREKLYRFQFSRAANETETQLKNNPRNLVNRAEILNALSPYLPKKIDIKRNKFEEIRNIKKEGKINIGKTKKNNTENRNFHRHHLPLSNRSKMTYPSTPKLDRHPQKYTYKDLMADRERLQQKIKYIKNMLSVNDSTTDDPVRVRRRSDSDKTADRIAKMFLTLSAVNGLHDRKKSKCKDEDDDYDNRVEDIWEKERRNNPYRKSTSSNEERYKVKKWIEFMKNKRSSGKTCPCMGNVYEEDTDAFPLEQKLPKGYFLMERGRSSEESSEYPDPFYYSRGKTDRHDNVKKRLSKTQDQESKIKGSGNNGKRKLEVPYEDLELYRSRARQILQNAEEILDKIKEEEEKRLATPNIFMNQLKELTSRIHGDPRNNENDLIRKIQKNLGWNPLTRPQDNTDGTFLDNVKSFILDPYEKAKALTDESTKKLSSYLLRNLGQLQESSEEQGMRNTDVKGDDESLKIYFEEVPRQEEKLTSANLAKEEPRADDISKDKENLQNWENTLSTILGGGEDAINKENNWDVNRNEPSQQQMEDIITEKQKILNDYKEQSNKETDTADYKESKEALHLGKDIVAESKPQSFLGEEKVALKLNEKETDENNQRITGSTREKDEKGIKGGKDPAFEKTAKESDIVENKPFRGTEGTFQEKEGESNVTPPRDMQEEEEFEKGIEEIVKAITENEGSMAGDETVQNSKVEENEEKANEDVVAEVFDKQEENEKENEKVGVTVSPRVEATAPGAERAYDSTTDERVEKKSDVSSPIIAQVEEISPKDSGIDTPTETEQDSKETVKAYLEEDELESNEEPVLENQQRFDRKQSEELKVEENKSTLENFREGEESATEKYSPFVSKKLQKESEKEDSLNDEITQQENNAKTLPEFADLVKEAKQSPKKLSKPKPTERKIEGDHQSFENLKDESKIGKGETAKSGKESQGEDITRNENADGENLKAMFNSENNRENKEAEKIVKSSREDSTEEDLNIPLKVTLINPKNLNEPLFNHKSSTTEPYDFALLKETNSEDQKNETVEDINDETSKKTLENKNREVLGKENNHELLLAEKPTKDVDDEQKDKSTENNKDEAILKEPNPDEVFENVNEDGETPLRAVMSNQDVKDDDESQEYDSSEVNDSDGNLDKEGSDETNVKASLDKKVSDETNVKASLDKEGSDETNVKASLDKEGSDETNVKASLDKEGSDETNVKASLDKEGSVETNVKASLDKEGSDETNLKASLDKEEDLEKDGDITLKANIPNAKERVIQDQETLDSAKSDVGSYRENQENDEVGRSIETLRVLDTQKNRDEAEEATNSEVNQNVEEISDKDDVKETVRAQTPEKIIEDKETDQELLKALNNQETENPEERASEETLKKANPDENIQDERSYFETLKADNKKQEPVQEDGLVQRNLFLNKPDEDENLEEILENKTQENFEEKPEETLKAVKLDEESGRSQEETNLEATLENQDNDEELKGDMVLKEANIEESEENLKDDDDDDVEAILNIWKLTDENEQDLNEGKSQKNEEADDEKILLKTKNFEEELNNQNPKDQILKAVSSEQDEENLEESYENLQAENTEEGKENEGDQETSFRSLEDTFDNKIEYDTPLKSVQSVEETPDVESVKNVYENESGETLRSENIPHDLKNQIDEENENEAMFESTHPYSEFPDDLNEGSYEKIRENLEAEPPLKAQNPENVNFPSETSQSGEITKLGDPKKSKSLKPSKLKVPESIKKIMKDLDGKEKSDITSLNPDKIDHMLDKIGEAEQQNLLESNEVDCKKECKCAEEMTTRSKNIGRYEIAKDFLQWMKDLQLNRVLSDD